MEDYLIYNTIGDGKYPDSFKENYHCHILCRSGEMRFEAMENPFTAGPGDLVIWQMTTRISNVIYSDDFDADFLLISNPFLRRCSCVFLPWSMRTARSSVKYLGMQGSSA